MDMRSYEDWQIHNAIESAVEDVTWNSNDLLTLDWQATYMTDEIPEDSSWDTIQQTSKDSTVLKMLALSKTLCGYLQSFWMTFIHQASLNIELDFYRGIQ